MSHKIQQQRNQLRKTLRQQRNLLDESEQEQHAQALAQQLQHSRLYKRSKRIAAYLPADGEIDPAYLIERAWHSNKQVYLPVLAPFTSKLYFAPFQPDCKMKLNRFKIAEPDVHPKHWLRAQQLDLILMPLVGFDIRGNRLGMGGGFYDRSLNFTWFRKTRYSPFLIGLAHQLQCVEQLPHQDHDVPMSMVATEQELFVFK